MGSDITIYRWKQGKWVHTSHQVDRRGHHLRDSHSPDEFKGCKGRNEGDWLLVSGSSYFQTKIAAREIPADGTLWQMSGRRWHRLYTRTGGHAPVPDCVTDLSDEGDIVIDMRRDGRTGKDIKDGDFKFLIPSYVGLDDVLVEDVTVDIAFVQDDDAEIQLNGPPPQELVNGQIGQDPRDDQEDRALARMATVVHRIKNFMSEPGMMREWAEIQRGDSKPDHVAKFVWKLYEEATPSPTPGTTAVFDFTTMINDWDRAHAGYDDTGSWNDADAGFLSDNASTVFGATSAVLAGLGSLVDYIGQLKTIANSVDKTRTTTGRKEAEGTSNTAAMSGIMDAPKIVSGIFLTVNAITQAADKGSAAMSGASNFAGSMSSVATGIPFVGTVISLVTFARVLRKGGHAFRRYRSFKRMQEDNKQCMSDEMTKILEFAISKSKRKVAICGATGGVAAIGSLSSGILGATVIFGAANAWNPVGWTLLGASAIGGCGIVGYKVYRRVKRQKRHNYREAHSRPTNATDMARRLLAIARNDAHSDRKLARHMLVLYGVKGSDIKNTKIDEAVEQMVNRHMKHV